MKLDKNILNKIKKGSKILPEKDRLDIFNYLFFEIAKEDKVRITGLEFRMFRRALGCKRVEMLDYLKKHNFKEPSEHTIVDWESRKENQALPKKISSLIIKIIRNCKNQNLNYSEDSRSDLLSNITRGAAIGALGAGIAGPLGRVSGAMAGAVGGVLYTYFTQSHEEIKDKHTKNGKINKEAAFDDIEEIKFNMEEIVKNLAKIDSIKSK